MNNGDKRTKAIITSTLGQKVIVTSDELQHALKKHYPFLPEDMFLELLKRVLEDPTEVYIEESEGSSRRYFMFYRLNHINKFVVAVIKSLNDGNYFSSMYAVGKNIRSKHKKLKKVQITPKDIL